MDLCECVYSKVDRSDFHGLWMNFRIAALHTTTFYFYFYSLAKICFRMLKVSSKILDSVFHFPPRRLKELRTKGKSRAREH